MDKAANKAILSKLDELVEQVKLTNALMLWAHVFWGKEENFDGKPGNRAIPTAVIKPVEKEDEDEQKT